MTASGGTSATGASDRYIYNGHTDRQWPSARPTVPPPAGTNVTITGINFTGTTSVKFGTARSELHGRQRYSDHSDIDLSRCRRDGRCHRHHPNRHQRRRCGRPLHLYDRHRRPSLCLSIHARCSRRGQGRQHPFQRPGGRRGRCRQRPSLHRRYRQSPGPSARYRQPRRGRDHRYGRGCRQRTMPIWTHPKASASIRRPAISWSPIAVMTASQVFDAKSFGYCRHARRRRHGRRR